MKFVYIFQIVIIDIDILDMHDAYYMSVMIVRVRSGQEAFANTINSWLYCWIVRLQFNNYGFVFAVNCVLWQTTYWGTWFWFYQISCFIYTQYMCIIIGRISFDLDMRSIPCDLTDNKSMNFMFIFECIFLCCLYMICSIWVS
jgi:hypothetical protein